jgi:lipopolysaccharide export LptBFGC system permease protein LptF
MTPVEFLGHLAGFIAPALVVALILWGVPRLRRAGRGSPGARLEGLMLLVAGVAVLLGGLVLFGRDGKIATYAALVVVQGTVAWWLHRRR